jgi:uncharacterized protein YcgI (DUF1989 family)
MNTLNETTLTPGAAWYGKLAAGQVLRVTAQSVVDLVAFNAADTAEYFDTARTRIYNLNIYPAKGQRLFSKQNNPMARILRDDFAGIGRHDLQSSNACAAAMLEALAPLKIEADDLPDPLGLFRNMAIRQEDGAITPAPLAPPGPCSVEIEAEIDLLVAAVNCPDPKFSAPGKDAVLAILAP